MDKIIRGQVPDFFAALGPFGTPHDPPPQDPAQREEDARSRRYEVHPTAQRDFDALTRVLDARTHYRGVATTLRQEVNFSVDIDSGIPQCVIRPGLSGLLSIIQSNKSSAIGVVIATSVVLGLPAAAIVMEVVANVRSVSHKLTRLLQGVVTVLREDAVAAAAAEGRQVEQEELPVPFSIVFLNGAVKAWTELFTPENMEAFRSGKLVPVIPGNMRALTGE